MHGKKKKVFLVLVVSILALSLLLGLSYSLSESFREDVNHVLFLGYLSYLLHLRTNASQGTDTETTAEAEVEAGAEARTYAICDSYASLSFR
jgi:hypothetical protein